MKPVPDHLLPLIHRVRAAAVQDPPAAWQRRGAHAVGGLTEVGFGRGFGPLAGQTVRTSGLAGGGLAVSTADGWTAERLVLDWPEESLLLVPPGSWIDETRVGRSADFTKV